MLRRAFAGLVTLAALVLFTASAPGQERTGVLTGGTVIVGGQAGLNISDLSIEQAGEDLETESETGLRAGAVLGWNFSEVFGLQTGAAYSEKGASTVPTAGVERSVDLSYLEVPLVLNARIPTGRSPVTPRFYAGGSADLEQSCDVVETEGGEEFSEACDEGGLQGGSESTSLNLLVGAGIDLQAGPGAITVDARYDHGITDIFDDPENTLEMKNRSFQFTVGYQFYPGSAWSALAVRKSDRKRVSEGKQAAAKVPYTRWTPDTGSKNR